MHTRIRSAARRCQVTKRYHPVQHAQSVKEDGNAYEQDRIYLDEIMKSLFSVSKGVLVKMMNGLFNEDLLPEETEVTIENSEFVRENYDMLRGDLFLKFETMEEKNHYHLEFQTHNDGSMVLRMFDYGFHKARELARYRGRVEQTIYFPKQLVIFLDKNKGVADTLKLRIVMPDGNATVYRIPTLKAWELTEAEMLKRHLYPFLPLLLLNQRQILKKAARVSKDHVNRLMKEAQATVEEVERISRMLYDRDELDLTDFSKILLALQNLYAYMNRQFGGRAELEEEVEKMVKTLIDPKIWEDGMEKGREEGEKYLIKKMLVKGKTVDEVVELTDLPKAFVQRIQEELQL